MPGYTFYKSNKNHDYLKVLPNFNKTINIEDNYFTFHGINKFYNDTIAKKSAKGILLIDGVITNKNELILSTKTKNWEECFWKLYSDNQKFPSKLRGSFAGVIFDLDKNKIYFFVDQVMSKPLYYYKNEDELIVSTDIKNILRSPIYNSSLNELDIESSYMMLSYGFCINDNTIFKDIKKIQSGDILEFSNGLLNIESYYKLSFVNKASETYSESEYCRIIDNAFRKAIQRQYDKDLEYNYKHLVGLSGGLDSRMTSMVAHSLGYTNQTNFTFSQSNYLDQTIACKIASDLKHDWIFKSLDNGTFLEELDKVISVTGANGLYYGAAHSFSMYEVINFDNFGLIHTGQLGDVMVGTFIKDTHKGRLQYLGGYYSSKFLDKTNFNKKFNNISELETELMRQRGFNGTNSGLISANNYSETLSPFLDVDFMEACSSIPFEIRANHRIYKKWIMEFYPEIADYIWETTGAKITEKKLFTYRNSDVRFSKIKKVLLRKFNELGIIDTREQHMNPIQYWYDSNENLKKFIDNYFKNHINLLSDSILKNDCTALFNKGTATEKTQVLTLLAAAKLLKQNNQ